MNQQVWEIIGAINNLLNSLQPLKKSVEIKVIDLVEFRSKLRIELEALRELLIAQYSERDAYLVLFPLIAHCDEFIRKSLLNSDQLNWPSFQEEFYKVDDAGDVFYDLLDDLLAKPETLPLVYEIYLFCLKDGFLGRYSVYPQTIAEYIKKLSKHIVLYPLQSKLTQIPTPSKRFFFRIPNYSYYLGAALLLSGVYFLLIFLGSLWKPYV
jgi:type IV/VI secretion system ImpK/VasF family protein